MTHRDHLTECRLIAGTVTWDPWLVTLSITRWASHEVGLNHSITVAGSTSGQKWFTWLKSDSDSSFDSTLSNEYELILKCKVMKIIQLLVQIYVNDMISEKWVTIYLCTVYWYHTVCICLIYKCLIQNLPQKSTTTWKNCRQRAFALNRFESLTSYTDKTKQNLEENYPKWTIFAFFCLLKELWNLDGYK